MLYNTVAYTETHKKLVEEPPTKNSIQLSAPPQSVKNASQEANSYLGKYSYQKQANNNSLATTAVRKQAEIKSASIIPLQESSVVTGIWSLRKNKPLNALLVFFFPQTHFHGDISSTGTCSLSRGQHVTWFQHCWRT